MGKKVAIGAAAAAVGAGAYYLLGPKGKAHQKKAGALLKTIEKEVKGEVKKAKEVTETLYQKAVDVVSENYAEQYKMHEKEITDFAAKLKKEWKRATK